MEYGYCNSCGKGGMLIDPESTKRIIGERYLDFKRKEGVFPSYAFVQGFFSGSPDIIPCIGVKIGGVIEEDEKQEIDMVVRDIHDLMDRCNWSKDQFIVTEIVEFLKVLKK